MLQLQNPEQTAVVTSIHTITAALREALQSAHEDTGARQGKDTSRSIEEVCTTCRNVYPSIMRGLEVIQPQNKDNGELFYPTISSVIRLFEALLGRLHQAALDLCVREGAAPLRERTRSRAKGKGNSPTQGQSHGSFKKLSAVLIKMITTLDPSHDAHCELLEGMLCALLDHIGLALSLLVFSDPNTPSEPQNGILPPQGLTHTAHSDIETAIRAVTMEAPYLICILRQAMDFLHRSTPAMSARSLTLFSLPDRNSTTGKDVRRLIEEALQRTLLRAAFGDEDQAFSAALRRGRDESEDNLGQMLAALRPEEKSAEWFIGEVWEHLGWDILSGQRGL